MNIKQLAGEDVTEMDFNCEYTSNIPSLFKQLNISIAFTSYQAGRLMLVRSDGNELDVNYKSFLRPMGLTAYEGGITLGTYTQVINFQREDDMLVQIKQPLTPIEDDITAPRIKQHGKKQLTKSDISEEEIKIEQVLAGINLSETQKAQLDINMLEFKQEQANKMIPVDYRTDACFITRATHYTGMINIHDIQWGEEGLWAVNSSFSCLCTLDPDYSFVPRWQPYFISELKPEDRCHLNGMALKNGKPAYVTTFSKYDSPAMWRKGNKFDGTLMDVETNTILLDGLAMPHSPRWYNNKVYFCNSGHGLVCCYDPITKQTETITQLQGFTRGIDFFGPIMMVGLSKVRASDVTKPAPLKELYDETFSGVWLINLDETDNEKQIIGFIKFTGNVDQVYDIAVITDSHFPELIDPNHPRMRNHFSHSELQPIQNE
ncbi:TIGR03032 family protein [Pseudoalteromonas denitrificans]|uniref:TIGR03032 family protein n=1 Tax=Pseudoalteromonas denitrificans DSM 6059 TaxID=1123010 RepID=A0A1I1Q1H8_9GAMM|nr:TIGR03032 family protein [Pseudoalteromonas denitrificans]SFD15909.1 TIGR03032 family protein [Pseudoalteromonas denitrificans DSM 6059]